jgi:hypothetical protein
MVQQPGTSSVQSGTFSTAQQIAARQFGQTGMYAQSLSSLPGDTQIYMGDEYDQSLTDPYKDFEFDSFAGREESLKNYGSDGMFNVDEAKGKFWTLDETQRNRYLDSIRKVMAPDSKGEKRLPNETDIKRIWDNDVIGASAMTKATGEKISPFEFRSRISDLEVSKGNTMGSGGSSAYQGPTTTIQNNSEVSLSDPSQSRSFLETAMTGYLGRRPKEGEYEQFLASLNKQQESSPTTRRTVSKSSGNSLGDAKTKINSSSTGSTGLDEQQFAKEYAKSRSDYAETTLDTNGKNLIMQALGG